MTEPITKQPTAAATPPVASTVQGVSVSANPIPPVAAVVPPPVVKASSVQVGGDHYKNYHIQPFEFAMANNLNFLQGTIIKYVLRYKQKGGLEDLKKASHTLSLLMEW